MERYTKWLKGSKNTTYDIVWNEDRPEDETPCLLYSVPWKEAVRRLAEYEDMDMTPEEVRTLKEEHEYEVEVLQEAAWARENWFGDE